MRLGDPTSAAGRAQAIQVKAGKMRRREERNVGGCGGVAHQTSLRSRSIMMWYTNSPPCGEVSAACAHTGSSRYNWPPGCRWRSDTVPPETPRSPMPSPHPRPDESATGAPVYGGGRQEECALFFKDGPFLCEQLCRTLLTARDA